MKDSLKDCCWECKGSKYWSDDSGCLHGCHTTTEKKCKHLTIIITGTLIGCDDCKMGDAQLRKELSTTNTSDPYLKPYYVIDHAHCPQTNSPCGLKGKHRCCLCKKPVDTSDNWQESFGETDFGFVMNGRVKQNLITFIAKEKERSREEGAKHWFNEERSAFDAGKAAMLASVREKIAGMKIKHERHPDDKTWCNYCGYNDAIRDALSTLE